MYIFIIDKNNKPLMPTNPRRAKLLLKKKQAKVINLEPFTLKLTKDSTRYIQDISLGIDSGTKHIGVCASQNKSVLFEAEAELRDDIKTLLETRRENRRFLIKGFQLFDKVLYNNDIAFIYGRRSTGYFKIATIEGNTIHNSIKFSKLKLLEKAKTFLIIKKRSDVSSPCLKAGVSTSSFR